MKCQKCMCFLPNDWKICVCTTWCAPGSQHAAYERFVNVGLLKCPKCKSLASVLARWHVYGPRSLSLKKYGCRQISLLRTALHFSLYYSTFKTNITRTQRCRPEELCFDKTRLYKSFVPCIRGVKQISEEQGIICTMRCIEQQVHLEIIIFRNREIFRQQGGGMEPMILDLRATFLTTKTAGLHRNLGSANKWQRNHP